MKLIILFKFVEFLKVSFFYDGIINNFYIYGEFEMNNDRFEIDVNFSFLVKFEGWVFFKLVYIEIVEGMFVYESFFIVILVILRYGNRNILDSKLFVNSFFL